MKTIRATFLVLLSSFWLSACYHSGPTPPCSINSGNPGCYPFPSDAKKPVSSSDQSLTTKK